jgi:hypothetical protein
LETDLARLLMLIESTRERAATARRLARAVASNDAAHGSLLAYASELESEAEKLEAQAAVLKQSANQIAQESTPEQSIAAFKPPTEPEAGS